MSCEKGTVFFAKNQMRYSGDFMKLPLDIVRYICNISYIPEEPIIEDILKRCGKNNCVEKPRIINKGMEGIEGDDPYSISDCCSDDNVIKYNEYGRVKQITINHTKRMASHNGDWDDFDPHKSCNVENFELPEEIKYLNDIEIFQLLSLPMIGGLPNGICNLRKLKVLGLVYDRLFYPKSYDINLPLFFHQLNVLEELVICGYNIKNSDILQISELKNLNRLSIYLNDHHKKELETLDLSPLSKLEILETLDVDIPKYDFYSLKGIKNLKELTLDSNKVLINMDYLTKFIFNFPNLTDIYITGKFNGIVKSNFFKHPTLKYISIYNNSNNLQLDFSNEEFPECSYEGVFKRINVIGEIPESYQIFLNVMT
jgi:hypothetical protein